MVNMASGIVRTVSDDGGGGGGGDVTPIWRPQPCKLNGIGYSISRMPNTAA